MEPNVEPISVEDAMQDNVNVFGGHPADNDEGNKNSSQADDEAQHETDAAPEDDKTPDIEDDKETSPTGKDSEEAKKVFDFKYASQEAAEKAYREAEKLIGKSTADAKAERERAEKLQEELNLIPAVSKSEKKPEPAGPTSTDRMKELLEQVNSLDPEADDYNAKVAEIWGKRDDAIQADVADKVADALAAYDKKVKEDNDRAKAEAKTEAKTVTDANEAGKEAGLDMKKGSADSEMFWALAGGAPEGSMKDQISWTVERVKSIKDKIAAPDVAKKQAEIDAGKKAKENQQQNAVLERQGEGRRASPKAPATPLGISDAFQQIQRRV